MFNTPFREVHGGATPEEVLVPYIEIITQPGIIKYTINLLSDEISTYSPIISFKINPDPLSSPIFIIDNQKFCLQKREDIWSANLSGVSPSKYTTLLKIDNNEFDFTFKLKGSLEEEDLF